MTTYYTLPYRLCQVSSGQKKRFLTRSEYQEASERLMNDHSLDTVTVGTLLQTVKGLDTLKLLASLLEPECVTNSDIALMGMTLAGSYLEDGYAFALHELFRGAGDKLCRGRAEQIACTAVDVATRAMYTSAYTRENLEILKVGIHDSTSRDC